VGSEGLSDEAEETEMAINPSEGETAPATPAKNQGRAIRTRVCTQFRKLGLSRSPSIQIATKPIMRIPTSKPLTESRLFAAQTNQQCTSPKANDGWIAKVD